MENGIYTITNLSNTTSAVNTTTTFTINMEEREYKIIIKPSLARRLIKLGHKLVDIKPNKYNRESSVFVFLNTFDFIKDLEGLIKKK